MPARVLAVFLCGFAIACSSSETDSGTRDASTTTDANTPAPDAAQTDDATAPADDATTPSEDAGPDVDGGCIGPAGNTTLRASSLITFVTSTGEMDLPDDLTSAGTALLRTPTCFAQYTGTFTSSSAFEIAGLPAGDVYLDLGYTTPTYVVTASREVDLGYAQLGRPTVEPAVNPATAIALDLTNLQSWQANDDLELFSANANAFMYAIPYLVTNAPAIGETELRGETILWNADNVFDPNLVDTALGDSLTITQLSTRMTPSGEQYQSVSRAYTPMSFAIRDGETTMLTARLETITPPKTLSLDWKRSQFVALGADLPMSATNQGHTLYVFGIQSPERGYYAGGPDLVEFFASDDTDLMTDLTYADPLPASFASIAYAQQTFGVNVALPNTTPREFQLVTYAAKQVPMGPSAAVELAPIIGPPRAPKVAGMDATAPLQGVGLEPEVSWTAPMIGTPNQYFLRVYALANNNGQTQRSTVGRIYTTSTTVHMPPGMLAANTSYVFEISAFLTAGGDFESHPNRYGFPDGASMTLTAIIRP